MSVLLDIQAALSLGKEVWEKPDQAQSAHSHKPLKIFHSPLKVMQHWLDVSQPREDESGWAMIQYLTCTDKPDYAGSHVSLDYKHGMMKTHHRE